MPQWYRVFGTRDGPPEPEALLQHLSGLGATAVTAGRFHDDEQGWFKAELPLVAGAAPVELERYLATEEGIRGELNAWAAWLETAGDSPTHQQLMQQMIGTTQLITLRRPDDTSQQALLDHLCVSACQFLARATAGVYQVDGEGFFRPDGNLLVSED